MIETYNNMIFWIGYITVSSAMVFFAVSLFWVAFEKLMNTKKFFAFIFNNALDRSFRNTTQKQFNEWQIRMVERHKKLKRVDDE